MSRKEYKDFVYIEKEDYDKEQKINGEKVRVYSKKKLEDLYPEKDYALLGETAEKRKRDKDNDIGKLELADRILYVSEAGRHNKIFKKQGGFVEVKGGGFIALLKLRLLPIIILLALIFGIGFMGGWLLFHQTNEGTGDFDPNIKPVETEILTISGTVYKDGKGVEGAVLSLQKGNEEVGTATTDKDGNYLISNVANGNYNLVCTYGNSELTKIASVDSISIIVDFYFPADDLHDVEEITGHSTKEDLPESKPTEEKSDVKARVKIDGDNTPAVAVGGLDIEAMLHMIVGKEVDVTFIAKLLADDAVPADAKNAIIEICGELEMTYFDFSVLREIYKDGQLENSEYLTNTKTVLEIAVPYDSSYSVGTYAFRFFNGSALRLTELTSRPEGNYQDGSFYVTNDYVYIYANCFSTYAIGAAKGDKVVRGSDTISYSDVATVNLKTGEITMLYKHDADSTNTAKVEIYIVGDNGNLLISESDKIPVGYQIDTMSLKSEISNMPSVGTYNGLMKIIYLDIDGNTSTNVDIPLSVAITQ